MAGRHVRRLAEILSGLKSPFQKEKAAMRRLP
jgi:hypothetical protein